ncbi:MULTISPECIES: glycoside hydrolase family 97 protein [unclassified Caulobacter]|uniref:glycoside hydrolase family 97 protein n=1 Tax=unclassified Caulobacter TaxID=2648921 RepID=UPI000D37570F|nr:MULTISPECIES: glycoside hydrolase family 97 protein [unclassified Caulobacter]PTS88685.1 alpha-glucosidase [Caulobacter sp. HMWF009]PTT05183.1 alpha-glucosidase [Caulobacter sp. HMWF025]
MLFRLALAAFLLVAAPALAGPTATIASPDKVLSVEVTTDNDGRPSYTVARLGKPLIAPSRLGFILVDAPKLERNLVLAGEATRSFDETWEQPYGERRFIRNRYNELRVTLAEKNGLQRRFDVVFRVYDDGVGFRYEFPDQTHLKEVKIGEELTEFSLAEPATVWWIPAFEWNREEYLYHRTPVEEVGDAQTPMTVRTDNGLHIAFHEAALVDYSGMNLTRVEGRRFKANLTPGIGGPKVIRTAPFPTPWRTMQIADTAGGLVESNLVLNLNEPNALGDVSWIKPMKYVGVWWEMHLDKKTWASGEKHGATTENAIKHIDFAAKHGLGGVLVEGWNLGWDGDWFGNGQDFDFTKPYPDFDLKKVTDYARSKGVSLIGHNETSGNAAHYETQMGAAFDLYHSLGMSAVKTGYVADAGQAKVLGTDGQIHYAWHEGQDMARHHLKVVTEAAKRQVAINAHEPIKDTGLRRTYPNWISREGARGMEFSAWGQPGNPPEHEANLIFTRMLAGPMDYTPGIFGMKTKAPDGVATTWAKQLALYVTLYSPIQMAADLLENYEANPKPFKFIEDVPVDWSESHVLNGEIGDYVTIVRKDRKSDDWYLGAISDEEGRVLTAPLGFLEPGRRYKAQIYRDGDKADWKTAPQDIVIEEREVTSSDVLTLRLAPGGGQAIRFMAASKGKPRQ